MIRSVRNGTRQQVIDHLICCAFIEGRSCEKLKIPTEALKSPDPELASFYGGLVESEGNHDVTCLVVARSIDQVETERRMDFYLDYEAELIHQPHGFPALH